MAKTLKCDPTEPMEPYCGFNEKTKGKLLALNNLRIGNAEEAAWDMVLGRKTSDKLRELNRGITPYESDKGQFKRDMRRFAKDLAKAGL